MLTGQRYIADCACRQSTHNQQLSARLVGIRAQVPACDTHTRKQQPSAFNRRTHLLHHGNTRHSGIATEAATASMYNCLCQQASSSCSAVREAGHSAGAKAHKAITSNMHSERVVQCTQHTGSRQSASVSADNSQYSALKTGLGRVGKR